MICPHCGIGTSPKFGINPIGKQRKVWLRARFGNCTECASLIVFGDMLQNSDNAMVESVMLFPVRVPPRRVPPDVPEEYAQDYVEAALVLSDSPKASAALGRRLLQHTLREQGGFKARNLDMEIQAAIDSASLPPDLAHDLDVLRTLGNFAAHPTKSTNSGEVVNVEPGEAEWVLDLLDELLQHYFTRPAIRARRRAGLNMKLQEAGKPELKGTAPPTPGT